MLKISIRNILRHKLRTILTVLGIAIGIGLVIALGSLGEGLTASMQAAFSGNSEVIDVSATGGGNLTDEIIAQIEDIDGVEKVIPISTYGGGGFGRSTGGFMGPSGQSGASGRISFTAINPEDQDYFIGSEIYTERGRKLDDGDNGKLAALVGYTFAQNRNLDVGDEITFGNDTQFEIVGVIEQTGGDTDNLVLVPLTTMQEVRGETSINRVRVKAQSIDVVENVTSEIKIEIDNVNVFSSLEMARQISSSLDTVMLAVMGIGAVSAIVAGLMITVVMIMSVTERRREIGIMKAIGATEWMILKQVLQESLIIGLLGGVFGLLVGYSGSLIMNVVLNFPATVTTGLVILGMGFALILSTCAGLYPAWSASRLDPVQTLKYE